MSKPRKKSRVEIRVTPELKRRVQRVIGKNTSLSELLCTYMQHVATTGEYVGCTANVRQNPGMVIAPKEIRSDLILLPEGECEGEVAASVQSSRNVRTTGVQRELGIDPPGEWARLIASRIRSLSLEPFNQWQTPELARRIVEGVRPTWHSRPDLVVKAAEGVHAFWCSLDPDEQLGRRKAKGGFALWVVQRLRGECEFLANRNHEAELERKRADAAQFVIDDSQRRADAYWDASDEDRARMQTERWEGIQADVAAGRLIR